MVNVLCLIPIAVTWVVFPFYKASFINVLFEVIKHLCLTLPYARALEFEADRDGSMLAAKACVDVTEGHKLWITMARIDKTLKGTSNDPWWMSTHPTHTSRAQHLYSLIPEAKQLQNLYKC